MDTTGQEGRAGLRRRSARIRRVACTGLVVAALVLFAPIPSLAQRQQACSEPTPLVELVARSDLIAVVRILRRSLSIRPGQLRDRGSAAVQVSAVGIEIVDIIKRPFVEGYDFSKLQQVHHPPRVVRYDEHPLALAFLRYRGEDTWITHSCGLMPLDSAEQVYLACDAISDLFGHDRFRRERTCLLSHPAVVELSAMKQEIERFSFHARRYEGHADVMRVFPWQEGQPFQRVVLRVRGRNLQKLTPEKYRGAELLLTGYLPTERFPKSLFEQRFQKARRLLVKGTWFEGNFVVDEATK